MTQAEGGGPQDLAAADSDKNFDDPLIIAEPEFIVGLVNMPSFISC
jgi:hypothetical protein